MSDSPPVPALVTLALKDITAAEILRMEGCDLLIESAIGWSFDDMKRVADALGISDIDFDGKVERLSEGCDTCGYGAVLRVYGVGKDP